MSKPATWYMSKPVMKGRILQRWIPDFSRGGGLDSVTCWLVLTFRLDISYCRYPFQCLYSSYLYLSSLKKHCMPLHLTSDWTTDFGGWICSTAKQGDRFDTTCGILDRAGGFSFWWHSTSTCGERLSVYLDVPTLGAMACTFCDCPVSLIRSGWDDLQLHLHPQTLSFRYWFPRRLTSSFLGLNVPLHGHAFCCYWGTASSMQTKGYQLSFW